MRTDKTNKHTKKHPGMKRIRRKGTALILTLAMALTAGGCGTKEEMTGERVSSIFDLFTDDSIDPFADAVTPGTEDNTGGDHTVDLPTIEGTTENTESTEATEQATTEAEHVFASVENEELNDLFFEYFKESVTGSSFVYHDYIRDPDSFGIPEPEEFSLGETVTSAASYEEDKKHLEDWITRLEAIDPSTMTEEQYFDYDYLLDNLVTSRVALDNYKLSSSFSIMNGLQSGIPTIFTDYVLENKKDVENYIGYLNLIADYVHAELLVEQEKIDEGYGPSDTILDQMISQCDDCLAGNIDDHFMVCSFDDSLAELDFLTEDEKKEYSRQNKEAVEKSFLPAYEDMKSYFQSWKGKGKVEGGLCNYGEGGKDLYLYLLREYTGSDKTPQEMIDYLEKKYDEGMMEMAAIYQRNPEAYYYFQDNIETLYDYLKDKSAEEMIRYLVDTTMEEYPKMDEIVFKASYMHKSLEEVNKNTLAYYVPPALDDPDGSLIRVNGRNTSGYWETLSHEGCPGHMYQIIYYRRTDPRPFRIMASELGYMEGWAVYSSYNSMDYCDLNGYEYAADVIALDKLNSQLGYLYYGICDLGVNYKGWTLTDMKNYLTTNGLNADGAQEIYDIMVSNPGVYLSYSMGYYEMQDMRTYAENALGSKFDPVEYHRAVLDAGPCKYSQLKTRVDKYIEETK